MAGLEPARAFNGPTDFKSVASTIPPHRRFHSETAILPSKTTVLCIIYSIIEKHHSHAKNTCKRAIDGNGTDHENTI